MQLMVYENKDINKKQSVNSANWTIFEANDSLSALERDVWFLSACQI